MNSGNPFTVSFGRRPAQLIPRHPQMNEILDDFLSERASSQVYMITGIRGSGKTVLMTTVAHSLEDEGWIVIDLNPNTDMLTAFAGKLYDAPEMKKIFLDAQIDLSAFRIGVHIKDAVSFYSIESAIARMLQEIEKKGKRLLLTVDEAVCNAHVKVFAAAFQSLLREDYPVYLLMTGLFDNLYNLQNEKTLTFLYRAPKIILEPLSVTAIQKSYRNVFGITDEQAREMAELTKGYPFAFQVLGYLYWKMRDVKELLPEYDQYLEEYVYEKIWSELSEQDRIILKTISEKDLKDTKDIGRELQMSPQLLYVYKKRLYRKGIIEGKRRGRFEIVLPRFEEFVKLM